MRIDNFAADRCHAEKWIEKKKILMVKERVLGLRSFWGFINAVIGMIGGADKFIGLDSTEPEKPVESMPAPQCPVKHDENPPASLDQ
jgi:hypothetical protein